jgi:hypothetical protein
MQYTAPNWREENGVIYFSVTALGITGKNWITRLEDNDCYVGKYAKQLLRCPDFKPTKAGTLIEVAVLKGTLFEDNDRITKKIRAEGALRKLGTPEPELACLIRLKFTDKEIGAMGLWWIVTMHEPIEDRNGDPSLLSADSYGPNCWLEAYYGRPDDWWDRSLGFAFRRDSSECVILKFPDS